MTICVVTGSNRGIGLEICRQLKARGDHVIAACRDTSDELAALNVEIVAGIDVADPDSLVALRDAVADRKVGLVFNNAGILRRDDFDSIGHESVADMVDQFRVNSIGPTFTDTPLMRKVVDTPEKRDFIMSRIPMGKLATLGDIAAAAVYLASPAAAMITGTHLVVDGGWTAQ